MYIYVCLTLYSPAFFSKTRTRTRNPSPNPNPLRGARLSPSPNPNKYKGKPETFKRESRGTREMLFFNLYIPVYRIGIYGGVYDRYKKGVKNDPFKLLEIVLKMPYHLNDGILVFASKSKWFSSSYSSYQL